MMAIAVYPDNTFHEHFRWGTNPEGSNPDYIYTHLMHWFSAAHFHEVAVHKGFYPASEKGKYYDYTKRNFTKSSQIP